MAHSSVVIVDLFLTSWNLLLRLNLLGSFFFCGLRLYLGLIWGLFWLLFRCLHCLRLLLFFLLRCGLLLGWHCLLRCRRYWSAWSSTSPRLTTAVSYILLRKLVSAHAGISVCKHLSCLLRDVWEARPHAAHTLRVDEDSVVT